MTKKKLRVLIVEDFEDDALLLLLELKKGGYDPVYTRVDSAKEMEKVLKTNQWDIILADYALPGFTGLDALKIYKKSGLDIPFIIVSGTVGEDVAVETMKQGAHDYLMKGNLTRLVSAIEREIAESRIRKEHRNALERIKESALQWQTTFDSIQDCVGLIDSEGHILKSNKAMLDFFKKSLEDIIGKKCWNLVHNQESPIENCPFIRARKTHKRETLVITLDGRYFRVTVDPLFDERGIFSGGIHIMTDITIQKKAEVVLKKSAEQLEKRVQKQSKKLKETQDELIRGEKLAALGQLAGSIGHELRNPLGVMANAVYCLRQTVSENPRSEKYMQILGTQICNADGIITALLGLSRSTPVNVRETNISELVSSALEISIIPKNISVTQKCNKNVPELFIDQEQMVHALLNIIQNACQAMKEGGTLSVTSERHNQKIKMEISDTGVGISRGEINRIFEPLYSTRVRGIGLGLPLAKNLIEINNGTLNVKSVEGKGTTFIISFPFEGAVK